MDTWQGVNAQPITLNKYLYANADPANMVDPSGYFSMGSVMSAVNTAATLSTVAIASYDLTSSLISGEGVSATQAGMIALASLGGIKLFKVLGKKFLKRYNCGRANEHKICQIFKSDAERIHAYRSTLRISRTKNIAFADYITSSGVGSMVASSGNHTHPGTVGMPSNTQFVAFPTGRNNRETDSERKLYENMATRFASSTTGIARVVSERPICDSCAGVGRQFRNDYRGIFLMTRGGVTGGRSRR